MLILQNSPAKFPSLMQNLPDKREIVAAVVTEEVVHEVNIYC